MTIRPGYFNEKHPPADHTHAESLEELLRVGTVPAEKIRNRRDWPCGRPIIWQRARRWPDVVNGGCPIGTDPL